jgi:hypothetical protein
MSDDFSDYLERIERLEESEKQEIKEILGEKRMDFLKEDLEDMVEINERFIQILEILADGGKPISYLDELKGLRKEQERYLNGVKREVKLMVDNGSIREDNTALQKIERFEEMMEELEDHIIEYVRKKQPKAVFSEKDLERFIEKVKEAVLNEDRNDMRGVKRGRETGGVFRIREEDNNYYLDTYIHLDKDSRSTPHSFGVSDEIQKVMERVSDERGAENNFVLAHSHPPSVSEGTVFDHSQDDIDFLQSEEQLNLEGLTARLGVLAIRESEGKDTGIWIAVEMFLEDSFFIPVEIDGLNDEQLEKQYPRIAKYNQLLKKAGRDGGNWFDYVG